MSMVPSDIRPDSSSSTKPRRVLACVLCQQRKVKCDRRFPCANCVRSKAECVPAALNQRQRKRRFPERELLDRVRKYEDLLRRNNIALDTLHSDVREKPAHTNNEHMDPSDDELSEDAGKVTQGSGKPEGNKAKNFWHAVSRGFRNADDESDSSEDDVRESTVKRAWEETDDNGNHLLFGTRGLYTDLSLSHPEPVQILRLWQSYLDNVNPLLKITHIPTLQGRVIEAASNLTKIAPTLEALLFGIYCTAILSLSDTECQTVLESSKEASLMKYQIACQQALANCSFLRTDDRDCLTALFLYLVTVRHNTTPPIVSSLFGVAIRLGQRMGINNEYALTKCSIFEAEMRRRLWWSLVLFDARIGELSNTKPVTLDPSWDCRLPLNVNDADLRPEMKSEPSAATGPTEAVFAVLRSEVGDFQRHAEYFLEFNCPGLRTLAKYRGSGAAKLEKALDDKYFRACDEENPLHFVTIWSTRSALAKCRLLEHHAKYSESSTHQTESLRDTATSYAITLLEYDTKIMTSSLAKRFAWFNHFHFPFPAYIHIIQDLKRRPNSEMAQKAWEAMSDNFEPWLGPQFGMETPFFTMFAKIVLEAWSVAESADSQPDEGRTTPRIVLSIRKTLAESAQKNRTGSANIDVNMSMDDFSLPPLAPLDQQNFSFGMGFQSNWAVIGPEMYGMPGQTPMNSHTVWPQFGGRPGW